MLGRNPSRDSSSDFGDVSMSSSSVGPGGGPGSGSAYYRHHSRAESGDLDTRSEASSEVYSDYARGGPGTTNSGRFGPPGSASPMPDHLTSTNGSEFDHSEWFHGMKGSYDAESIGPGGGAPDNTWNDGSSDEIMLFRGRPLARKVKISRTILSLYR